MNIRDIFRLKPVAGDVGVEIELEGYNLPTINIPYMWRVTKDGSLKSGLEGYEYILKTPVPIADIEKNLTELKESFEGSKVIDSIYAGIHTHVNVQDLTPKQLITYLCSYIVLENLLVEWCSKTRVGNHFCLRSCDAEWIIQFIRDMIVNESLVACRENDDIRYSSFNLKSIGKYGSVEFRALEASLNVERITTWCKVLHRIKRESLKYDNPQALILDISKNGHFSFVMNMLGTYTPLFTKKNWEADIREGIVRAQELAFAKSWDTLSYNIFKQSSGGF